MRPPPTPDTSQNRYQLCGIALTEEAFMTKRGEVGERRLIQSCRIHQTALDETIDDQVQELNLVAVELAPGEEIGKGFLRRPSVETDEPMDE